MSISVKQLQGMMAGSQESRVEALRQFLGYPVKQLDPEGSRFWFLRPGADEDEAAETCPIAVGFYAELNEQTDSEIRQFLTADEQQREIYGHYTERTIPNQPVMYLLLPEGDSLGRVAMILPTEGKLRQRQIQTFSWSDEDLQARLNRLKQDTLARTNRIKDSALSIIPLVEWAFYQPITTAKELAQSLAEVSRRIERVIPDVYRAEPTDGYLRGLLQSFKRELLPTLKLEPENEKDYSFADIYAQTIAYGLFTARVFSYTVDERRRDGDAEPSHKETDFNREDAWELLPETNPFLRRLFRDVSRAVGEYDRSIATALPSAESDESPVIADELIDAISEVVSILRAAKMDAILEDFRAKMNREDIVIRFYEDFLAAYKPQMREQRGVYYTPEPVVSYMVRSVDILLKEKFDKPLGLADPEVMILDPACGTGTFLLWIFQEIYRKFQENPELLTVGLADQSWSGYVKERLLPRVFGFELLMAPYAIAHLKLGLFLEETGYQFDSGKRLGVYLTNSLDTATRKNEELFEEFIAEEADQAVEVKQNKKIMLVIGNPPYSINSENTSSWILELIKEYKKDLSEKKLNLDDDYIKFIRFAQWRIEETGYGIFAFISNNSYLEGLTHRRMRQSLLQSFEDIYILDLHGNTKKKERCPDGSPDDNVFDIQQGVSVGIFSKKSIPSSVRSIKHYDLWGLRAKKYQDLINEDISTTNWNLLKGIEQTTCLGSLFFFTPKAFENIEEYCEFISLKEIFSVYQNGLKTDRDELFFDFDKEVLEDRIISFYSDEGISDDFRKKYRVEKSSSYDLVARRNTTSFNSSNLRQCLYRPFDSRWLYYAVGLTSRPAWQVMQHMMSNDNLALITTRQTSEDWSCFVTSNLCGHKSCAAYDINSLFPLYLHAEENTSQKTIFENQRSSNFSQSFLKHIKSKLGYIPVTENIFNYIYAIFYSSLYRARYVEFLRIDYPRVPFTSQDKVFRQLAAFGEELVALHLMKSPKLNTFVTKFEGNSSLVVDAGHPKYVNGKVIINKRGDGFTGVPEEVWNFYVGGYQVCQRWLRDRRGRVLSEEDITHYQRIVVALQETIRIMQQIDEAIPGWPLE